MTSSPSTVGPPQAPRRGTVGSFFLDWGAVQPQIATSTRVCAHDRGHTDRYRRPAGTAATDRQRTCRRPRADGKQYSASSSDPTWRYTARRLGMGPLRHGNDGPTWEGIVPYVHRDVSTRRPPASRLMVGHAVRPFLVRDSPLTPRLPDRLLSHRPPSSRPRLHRL